jgi:hypothetical protein
VSHVKLEPYKEFSLDVLDMMLLGCLFLVAVASLVFQLDPNGDVDTPFIQAAWKYAIFACCAGSTLGFVSIGCYEVWSKFLRTSMKVRFLQYEQKQSALTSPLKSFASTRFPQIKINAEIKKIGSRGNTLVGSLLHSLTPEAVAFGFATRRVTPMTLALFSSVTIDAAEYIEHTSAHSFLSHTPEAVFFRRIGSACPELIDVLCCVDPACIVSVNALRQGLNFLCLAVKQMESQRTPFLHTAIKECDFGALSCYLTTKACEDARQDFAKMLSALVKDYVPPEFKVISDTATSLAQTIQSPRVRTQSRKQNRFISLLKIKRGSSGIELSKVRPARPLEPGTKLFHSVRGFGRLVHIDIDEPRGKHFHVTFASGESHHYDAASLHKMKVVGSDSKMQSIELIIDNDAIRSRSGKEQARTPLTDTSDGSSANPLPESEVRGSRIPLILDPAATMNDHLGSESPNDVPLSDVQLNELHLAIENWMMTPPKACSEAANIRPGRKAGTVIIPPGVDHRM